MATADAALSAQQMARAAANGDVRAFEALVGPHLPSVRRVAYSFCRDWSEADDLAQEALLKAFRSIGTFTEGSGCGAWLFAVTRSVCLDWYRKHKRTKLVEFDENIGPREVSHDPRGAATPERHLEVKTELSQLWDAIRKLEPEFRVPLVLFEIEGLSYDDIARVEQVPVGTVRSRLARARAQLSALVSEETAAPTGTLSARKSSPVRHSATPRGPPSGIRHIK